MHFMRFTPLWVSFHCIGEIGSMCILKGLPLASKSEGRAAVVAMSLTVEQSWKRMWLEAQVHELL